MLGFGNGKRGLMAGMVLISMVGWGCESGHTMRAVEMPADFDVRGVAMFNGRTGDAVSWEELQLVFEEADVVVIGEQHGHPIGLPVAAAMFDDALARNGEAGLALEFFGRDYQIAIDDYLADITDEDGFKKAARRTAGSYPAGHRQMLEAAKAGGRPVIAAMVPRRYTLKLTTADGFEKFEKLNERQMAMIELPKTMPESGDYHDRFFDLMSGMHGVDDGAEGDVELTEEEKEAAAEAKRKAEDRVKKSFSSMNTWDVTMADSVLGGVRGGAKPMVLVVGQFHSDFGGGIPARLIEEESDLFIWTISLQDVWSDELREEDEGRADCVIYVGPAME